MYIDFFLLLSFHVSVLVTWHYCIAFIMIYLKLLHATLFIVHMLLFHTVVDIHNLLRTFGFVL